MAKQGIGSAAGGVSGATEAEGSTAAESEVAPKVASSDAGGRVTAGALAKELLRLAELPATAANAASAKRLASTLHRVHGSTTPELKGAVAAYYNDPTEANAAALKKSIKSQKFDG